MSPRSLNKVSGLHQSCGMVLDCTVGLCSQLSILRDLLGGSDRSNQSLLPLNHGRTFNVSGVCNIATNSHPF